MDDANRLVLQHLEALRVSGGLICQIRKELLCASECFADESVLVRLAEADGSSMDGSGMAGNITDATDDAWRSSKHFGQPEQCKHYFQDFQDAEDTCNVDDYRDVIGIAIESSKRSHCKGMPRLAQNSHVHISDEDHSIENMSVPSPRARNAVVRYTSFQELDDGCGDLPRHDSELAIEAATLLRPREGWCCFPFLSSMVRWCAS